jgi:chromosome segregation ATPase
VTGALEWQLARQWPERRWQASKDLDSLTQALEAAAARDAALQAAQASEPERFDAFDGRIAGLRARISALLPQAAALQQAQQRSVQAMAIDALREQQARLADYGTQARFALAQLQDRATVARLGGDDAAR